MEEVTDIQHLVTVLKDQQAQLNGWISEKDNFIPLLGSHNSSMTGDLNLDDEVESFLSNDQQTVMLLTGQSGAGKSLFTQRLVANRGQNFEDGSPIPLWISLPSLVAPEQRAIEETLEKFGFDKIQIEELRNTQSFIFVLDAYDEIQCLKNLYVTNQLNRWKAKVIITCRYEYLYWLDNFHILFTPFVNSKPQHTANTILYVNPFSVDQIETYVCQYLKRNENNLTWNTWPQYSKAIEHLPGLKKLISTPFTLKLAVEALPTIAKRFEKIDDEHERNKFTLTMLYDEFITSWFFRQEQKLKANNSIKDEEDIKPEFWHFAKALAKTMHEHNVTQVYYDPEQAEDLFDEDEQEESPWQTFFDNNNPRTQLLLTACLIKEVSPNVYAFEHTSLLEYFLSSHLFTSLTKEKNIVSKKNDRGKEELSEIISNKSKGPLSDSLIVKNDNLVQFLADRIYGGEVKKERLLELIFASRNNPEGSVAAANAITILVRAGVQFNFKDLSGVKIKGASISGGFFDSINFSNADMRDVKAHHVTMRNANLLGCWSDGLDFGEKPYFTHHFYVHDFVLLEDKDILVSAAGASIHLWNSRSGEYIRRFQDDARIFVEWIRPVYSRTTRGDISQMRATVQEQVVFSSDGVTRLNYVLKPRNNKPPPRLQDRIAPSSPPPIIEGHPELTTKLYNNTFSGHSKTVICIFVSKSGNLIASGSRDMTIRLWDIAQEKELLVLNGHTAAVTNVHISKNEQYLISSSRDKTLRIWDISRSGKITKTIHLNKDVCCTAINPDGTQICTGSKDAHVRIINIYDDSDSIELLGHKTPVMSVKFSPDGNVVASRGNNEILIWSIDNKCLVSRLTAHENAISCINFNSTGDRLVSADAAGTIYIWNIASNTLLFSFPSQNGEIEFPSLKSGMKNVKFTKADDYVIFSSPNNEIRTLKISKSVPIIKNSQHNSVLDSWFISDKTDYGVALSTKSNLAITYINNYIDHYSEISFRDLSNGKLLNVYNNDYIGDLSISPCSPIIALVQHSVVSIINVHNEELMRLERPTKDRFRLDDHLGCVSFSPCGNYLVSGDLNFIYMWDIKTAMIKKTLRNNGAMVKNLRFTQDGTQLLSLTEHNLFSRWDLVQHGRIDGEEYAIGKCVAAFSSCDKSSCGEYVALGDGHENDIIVRKLDTSQTTIEAIERCNKYKDGYILSGFYDGLSGHDREVTCLNFFKGHDVLISGSLDKTVRVWDVKSKKCQSKLKFETEVIDLVVSKDGSMIVAEISGHISHWKCASDDGYHWGLFWSTKDQKSSLYLDVDNIKIHEALGLSPQNQQLLKQYGANACFESKKLPSVSLIAKTWKQNSRPLYKEPTNDSVKIPTNQIDKEEQVTNQKEKCVIF